ncbi:MAG: SMP-30/gluconolactonase/LRE family protein [Acidobacteria bacterium]|nr:SMP-30/gluconolactonase/LRE family protein [Acidobacteriota bacterium]MDA1235074.1 SMP-30/gluconolactonase/LRE family protein [Acidobacteriota bacterium]
MIRTFISALCLASLAFTAAAQDLPLSQILVPGEEWELVADGYQLAEGPSADREGNLYFADYNAGIIYKVDHATKNITTFTDNSYKTGGMMVGPDGLLYAAQAGGNRIAAYTSDGIYHVIADGISVNDLVVAGDNSIWFTDPDGGRVWYISPDRLTVKTVAEDLHPNGIILAHREGTVVVTDRETPHLWAFRAELDGSLTAGAPVFAPLRLPFETAKPGSDGMTVDTQDRVFVATTLGIQVFDTEDRFSGVIDTPIRGSSPSNLTFAGPNFDYLYVTTPQALYRLRTATTGVPYFLRDYQAIEREQRERLERRHQQRRRQQQ